jgi:hypothetical protein
VLDVGVELFGWLRHVAASGQDGDAGIVRVGPDLSRHRVR